MVALRTGRPSKNKESLSLDDVKTDEKLKRVTFAMPENLYRELKMYSASNGLTVRAILNNLVTELLEKNSK